MAILLALWVFYFRSFHEPPATPPHRMGPFATSASCEAALLARYTREQHEAERSIQKPHTRLRLYSGLTLIFGKDGKLADGYWEVTSPASYPIHCWSTTDTQRRR